MLARLPLLAPACPPLPPLLLPCQLGLATAAGGWLLQLQLASWLDTIRAWRALRQLPMHKAEASSAVDQGTDQLLLRAPRGVGLFQRGSKYPIQEFIRTFQFFVVFLKRSAGPKTSSP